ncbi:histidine kinase [Psychroserpens sp.]
MLKSLVFLLVFFNTSSNYAQNKELEILKKDIQLVKNDRIKAKLLLDLSNYFHIQDRNLDSMIYVAKKAASLSEKSKAIELSCKAYGNIGTGYLLKNYLDSSYYHNNKSYIIAKQLDDPFLLVPALIRLNSYYVKKNDLVKAIDHGLMVVKIAEKAESRSLMAEAYYKLSNTFAFHDDSKKFKHYLDKAYRIIEREKIEVPVSLKSDIYGAMVNYFENRRFKNPENTLIKDSLNYYVDKGISYGKSINRPDLIAYLLGIRGKQYYNENNIVLAKSNYQEALKYRNEIGKTTLHNLYNKLAHASIKENNIKQGLLYKDSILQDITEEPSNYRIAERYRSAYYICKHAELFDLALGYHEKMVESFDKVKENDQIKTLNELEIKYETQRKDIQIASQKLENETLKRKAITNYSILGVIAIFLMGILGYMYFRKKNKVLKTELSLANTKAVLHRSQINPHFISNSINTIYPFLYDKSDPNKAAAYLSDLSQMIRSILDSTFDTSWTVKRRVGIYNSILQHSGT